MFDLLHLSSYLGVVKVEAGPWLGRGGVGVDSQHEGLFASCNGGMNDVLLCHDQSLLMRAAEVVWPSMPKIVPHM